MTNQTVVSVYGVEASGATGAWLGTGSLVHPQLVLVHPELSGGLATQGGQAAGMRVGIAYLAGSGHAAEVIDTASVHIGDSSVEPGAEPLVALRLKRPASGPVVPLVPATAPIPDAAGLAAAARRRLAAEPPIRKPEEHIQEDELWWPWPKPPSPTASPWCEWLGVGCPKKKTHRASAE